MGTNQSTSNTITSETYNKRYLKQNRTNSIEGFAGSNNNAIKQMNTYLRGIHNMIRSNVFENGEYLPEYSPPEFCNLLFKQNINDTEKVKSMMYSGFEELYGKNNIPSSYFGSLYRTFTDNETYEKLFNAKLEDNPFARDLQEAAKYYNIQENTFDDIRSEDVCTEDNFYKVYNDILGFGGRNKVAFVENKNVILDMLVSDTNKNVIISNGNHLK